VGKPGFSLSLQNGYILVERPPDYEVVLSEQPAMFEAISAACEQAGCRKVLIMGSRTKVSLEPFDIFELGKSIAKLQVQLAMVEAHDATTEEVNFLENVAWNRGGEIRFFDTVDAAREWLGVPE